MMSLPSTEAVNDKRIADFNQSITDTLASKELGLYLELMDQYRQEHDVPALDIAAALALMLQGDKPLLLSSPRKATVAPEKSSRTDAKFSDKPLLKDEKPRRVKSSPKNEKSRDKISPKALKLKEKPAGKKPASPKKAVALPPGKGMERFRIEVGDVHGAKPKDSVGAIANEAELDGKFIGAITIEEDHSFVDLPIGMPSTIFELLKKVRVAGLPLKISRSTKS
jgi:ATP-dependent RNA helicase DeaD